jgi:hypothetical protein
VRCGCTEARACDGGCHWVLQTDVCSACLQLPEQELLELVAAHHSRILKLQMLAAELGRTDDLLIRFAGDFIAQRAGAAIPRPKTPTPGGAQ